jgi:UDP-N-acetylmuramoylalanine--D-glutamate ligase
MTSRRSAFEPGAAVSVLGLGLSGQAAARLASARGGRVYASDVSDGRAQREAASRLRSESVAVETGGHDLERILASDLVVVSPGISPFSEIRQRIAASGVRTIAEIELAYRDLRSRVIAITGTNGKTTTTQLTAHVLQAGGIMAEAVGNIGRPLSETALAAEHPEWVAVELSSFQLADLEDFTPEIGVLLNLSPDHLDRYRDVESYYADKRRLFANATPSSRWILNADDQAVLNLADGVDGDLYLFSLRAPTEQGAFLNRDGWLTARLAAGELRWTRVRDLTLLGEHNVANCLAAGLAATLAGCDTEQIGPALGSFRALPHRLAPVEERVGVLWVNDSKATNISATRVAILAFDRPVVLLLGGRHKGEPYSGLSAAIEQQVKAVVAFGEAAQRIVSDLGSQVSSLRVESDLESAVQAAAELALPGDVVLFSPACSSYDVFPDYEVRGEAFARAVRSLGERKGSAA